MKIVRKKIADLERAAYNPRVDLQPGDAEYEALAESLRGPAGFVIPIVWNERTNRVVGGHQRLTVLQDLGETEVEVSVVDLDEDKEKALNIALNKIEGRWDNERLAELLEDMGEDAKSTGFEQYELDALKADLDDLLDDDVVQQEAAAAPSFYNLPLTFDKADEADIKDYIKENGKEPLVKAILARVREGY